MKGLRCSFSNNDAAESVCDERGKVSQMCIHITDSEYISNQMNDSNSKLMNDSNSKFMNDKNTAWFVFFYLLYFCRLKVRMPALLHLSLEGFGKVDVFTSAPLYCKLRFDFLTKPLFIVANMTGQVRTNQLQVEVRERWWPS